MSRFLKFFLAFSMLFSLWACEKQEAAREITEPTQQSEIPQALEKELPFGVQFVRTYEYGENTLLPDVQIIDSYSALKAYCPAVPEIRNDEIGLGAFDNLENACAKYDEDFFRENYLIFVILEEGSGSIRHYVDKVVKNNQGDLEIWIQSVLPGGFGTDDEAHWHIVLELNRTKPIPTTQDIAVYLDHQKAYEYGHALKPRMQAQYPTPPTCVLVTPEGDIGLEASSYDWNFKESDGNFLRSAVSLTDRPLAPDEMEQVFIHSKWANTIDCRIPGTYLKNPVTDKGYLIEFDWPVDPRNVTITCWSAGNRTEVTVANPSDSLFDAWQGSYIYEIHATWPKSGGYYGTATYYVYITDDDTHEHATALRPETVDEPLYATCGNTMTTVHWNGHDYSFMYGYSTTLTDILTNLDYNPGKVCRCLPEFTVDTEFGMDYGISLTLGYARCQQGQANLTTEQVMQIQEILDWLSSTNGEYTMQ